MDLIETIVGTLRDSSACHEVIEAVRARRSWLSELGAVDLENDTRPDWQLQERIAWIERTCELDSLEAQPELDPSSFEEAETLWAARVSRRFCGEVTPQEVPQAVLVTGQPGAGKSVVCEIARRELAGQGGCVLVDSQLFLLLHPCCSLAPDDSAADFAEVLASSASLVAALLVDESISRRTHLIVEIADSHAAAAAELSQALRQAGYRVDLIALCIPGSISWQRIQDDVSAERPWFERTPSHAEHRESWSLHLALCQTLAGNDAVDEVYLLSQQADIVPVRQSGLVHPDALRARMAELAGGELPSGRDDQSESASTPSAHHTSTGRKVMLGSFPKPPDATQPDDVAQPLSSASLTAGPAQESTQPPARRPIKLGKFSSDPTRQQPSTALAMDPAVRRPLAHDHATSSSPATLNSARSEGTERRTAAVSPNAPLVDKPASPAMITAETEPSAGLPQSAHPAAPAPHTAEIDWSRYPAEQRNAIRRRLEMQQAIHRIAHANDGE